MSAATPSDIHAGGLNVSISALATWERCPRDYFWGYVYEWPDGTTGSQSMYVGTPLLVGGAVDAGLANYYESGWRDGKYSSDAAMQGCREYFSSRAEEAESEEKLAEAQADAERIVLRYIEEYAAEYPTLRVADIDGKPLIQHTFYLPLYTGHVLTVRPDMVVWNFDSLVCWELKCCEVRSVWRHLAEARLGGQGLAQEAVLHHFDLPVNGQLLQIAVREWKPTFRTRPLQREVIPHDEWAVGQLLTLAGDTVTDILRAVDQYHQLRDDGFSSIDAGRKAFRMKGTLSGQCVGKFGKCSRYELCASSGREEAMLANFKRRVYRSDVPAEEA